MKSLLLLVVFSTCVFSAPQVKLGTTTLIGRDVTGLKQDFFGGIPYVEPPLGNLRLKPPVLKRCLNSTTFDASNFGLACLQVPSTVQADMTSEDCLTINVFRPSNIGRNTKLPVLLWTHPGGFQEDASFRYNGSLIVNRSVERGTPLIYVSFNYRLGPLGFPEGQEAFDKKALNLGIRDVIAALEWVQLNIGVFGGDQDKVILYGQSAGAMISSMLLVNYPNLDQLTRGLILESGSPALETKAAAGRQVFWNLFVEGVPSCADKASSGNTFDCLLQASSAEMFSGMTNALHKAPALFPWQPSIDGPGGVFQDLPSRVLENDAFPRLPFIAGNVKDELTFMVPGPQTLQNGQQIHDFLIANFSPPLVPSTQLEQAANRLLELYPDTPALGSPFGTGNETFGLSTTFKRAAAIFGDILFNSQRRFWQQKAAKAGTKTWGYIFTQPQPQNPPLLGTTHSDELPFVYGQVIDPTSSALNLSTIMMDYWISFATSLDPNDGKGMKRPLWQQYTSKSERLIQLNGDDLKMIDDTFRKEQMDYINSNPAVFYH